MEDQYIKISSDKVIEFVNTVNEICKTIDEEFVGEWLTTRHGFLDSTPLEEFNTNGMVKIFDLLTLIDLDEADVID
jgi:hypothetical protein